jgi:hypothetical protein
MRLPGNQFQPADAGGRIKPGVERGNAEPQEYGVSAHQAREAGGSFLSCAISSSLNQWLSPASQACVINLDRTGVPLRFTPGFILPPASAG